MSEEIKLLREDVDRLKSQVKGIKDDLLYNQKQVRKKTPYGSILLCLGLVLMMIGITIIISTIGSLSVLIGVVLFIVGIPVMIKGIKRLR